MKHTLLVATVVAALAAPSTSNATPLFSDDFNTPASELNYTKGEIGLNAVTWAFDYSTVGIPPAPNTTDGTTIGVKFESNMTSPGAAAGVTLHTLQQFSGNYRVKFDAWINANGPFPGGGTGSTEFVTAGVGGDGSTVNRVNVSGINAYVAVDGEGGSGIDYRLYKGTTLQDPASGQYAAGNHSTARNANDPYYAQFGGIDVGALPVQGGVDNQTGEVKVGAAGFAWREVELHVDSTGGTGGAASVAWYLDGLLIGTLDAGIGASFSTDGSVAIGYADPFASVSDAPQWSFGVIDNLSVIPEPTSIALGIFGIMGLMGVRRRS